MTYILCLKNMEEYKYINDLYNHNTFFFKKKTIKVIILLIVKLNTVLNIPFYLVREVFLSY